MTDPTEPADPGVADHPVRILIVDDEPHNRKLLEVMLTPEGFLFETAESGEEALACVARHPPDLVLLDVMMPGMDGYEVAARLKGDAATKHIPIIMLTALDDREAVMRGLDAGAEDFLSKPVDRGELRVRVRNMLRLKAWGDHFTTFSQKLEAEVASRTAEHRLLSERLSLATAVARVGVWEWDLASNALTWDTTMFDIYGLPPVVPMAYDTWAAMVEPEDLAHVEATLQSAIDEKGEGSAEFRIVRADGAVRNITAAERVVLDDHGDVARVIGVNLDITERKAAEEALAQSRRDQLQFKDDFLSHVSHELRSPLTAIKQFSSILHGGLAGELTPAQQEYQGIVLKNVHQLQSMIDDLLEVTRLETGKLTVEPEAVSVADAVTDTIDTLQGPAESKGVGLSMDVPTDLPAAYADRTRLRQILIILLDNAIKFTPGGGSAHIRARRMDQDPPMLRLEVSDTGSGIPPEIAEDIFERLYQVSESTQSSRKGLGLGLFISRELVSRQGGRIWVDSEPGEGSTFSFTLPVFSLSSVIAPLLKDDEWPAESVALLTVEVDVPNGSSDESRFADVIVEARSIVQRCLLPDLDVLLPGMAPDTGRERFFIAAFAEENGAAVLANRLREQFSRLPDLDERGVTISVSSRMLPPLRSEDGVSTEEMVADMAAHLEDSVMRRDP